MNQTEQRIAQSEGEVRVLKSQLGQSERKKENLMQEDLEKICRRQEILVKLLQIMQSAENLPKAMNEMLAEIGKFSGVSRVYCLEKNADETTIRCTYDWCNTGITRIIDNFQIRPVKDFQPWFDLFAAGQIINTSDINTLIPQMFEIVNRFGVKSYLVFPLTDNGVHYGLVGFHDCVSNREWDENEVELLGSLSKIISAARRRFRIEQE